jgi:hypothetical protein
MKKTLLFTAASLVFSASLFAQTPGTTGCYATSVVNFNQLKRNDGSIVPAAQSDATQALGAPQDNESQNFVSLGFGGSVTLSFDGAIANGEGTDIRVVESTFNSAICRRYPERVRAFASQDGCHFVYLGEGCQDYEFDLGSLEWAQYVKLVDASPLGVPYQGQTIVDGYDVDGVVCLNGTLSNPVPAAVELGANEVISYAPGLRRNGTPVEPARTNPNSALGLPQNTNTVNFVSLGFGGSLVLKFDYVIFDNPLMNDLKLVETSFGNPSCTTFPELAAVEVSLDGINWTLISTVCQDGEIDITTAGTIQYVRLTDRSKASAFSGTADGYDVDGVVVINELCGNSNALSRIMDDVTFRDEEFSASLYPNPALDQVMLTVQTTESDNQVNINVMNTLGQIVKTESVNCSEGSTVQHALALNGFTKGIYFVSIETTSGKEVIRLTKN